jgi:hypothetical protein
VATVYTQELLDRATAYAGQPLTDRRSPAGLAELASIYSAITGLEVGSCRQCQYSDFLAAISNYSRAATRFLHPETMPDTKYAFAPGLENEQLVHDSYGKVVTAENLEDKDVEFFKSKGLDKLFVLKSKKDVAAPAATDGSATTDGEADENDALKKAQDEVAAGKEALKTEKTAHSVTKKKLAETEKDLAKATKSLADAQTALEKATVKPTGEVTDMAPPVDPGATA